MKGIITRTMVCKLKSFGRLTTLLLLLICCVAITLSCTSRNGKSFKDGSATDVEKTCDASSPKSVYAEKERLRRITGVVFPDFKVVDYKRGERSFHGDYTDEVIIEFKAIPSDDFYQTIDSLIKMPDSYWSKKELHYSYSRMWGNGIPTPEGENDEEDMTFNISFDKGSKQVTLTYGAW